MSESFIDTIFARRSIRRYTSEPVTEEQIKTLLEAAMAAPSANNLRPWHFVVVTERETLKKLAEAHPYGKMLFDAALAIVVCGEPGNLHWVQDCSAASQNILLAATALGLGGVWLGVHPRTGPERNIRRVLDIPEEISVLNVISIGHPAEKKPPRTQYEEIKVHRERW